MNGLSGVTTIFSMIFSMFSLGSSGVTQYRMLQRMPTPPAQVQHVQCPPATQPQLQQLPDGGYRVVCVEVQP